MVGDFDQCSSRLKASFGWFFFGTVQRAGLCWRGSINMRVIGRSNYVVGSHSMCAKTLSNAYYDIVW